jgi:hypothetical protein
LVGMHELEFGGGRGKIWTQGEGCLGIVPGEIADKLAPARYFAYEWVDY